MTEKVVLQDDRVVTKEDLRVPLSYLRKNTFEALTNEEKLQAIRRSLLTIGMFLLTNEVAVEDL